MACSASLTLVTDYSYYAAKGTNNLNTSSTVDCNSVNVLRDGDYVVVGVVWKLGIVRIIGTS